jgi:hypothetical protein
MEHNTVKITFRHCFDDGILEEEIREYFEYQLGISTHISLNNSLIANDLDGFDLEVE